MQMGLALYAKLFSIDKMGLKACFHVIQSVQSAPPLILQVTCPTALHSLREDPMLHLLSPGPLYIDYPSKCKVLHFGGLNVWAK